MNSAAELRFLRIMAGLVGIGSLLFAWLASGAIVREAVLAPPWWSIVAVIAVFVVPVAAAIITFCVELLAARIALGVAAGIYLLTAVGSLVYAYPSPWVESAWVLNNTGLGTCLAGLAFPRLAVWLYNGGVALLVVAERVHSYNGGAFAGIQHGLYAFAFGAVFTSLIYVVLIQARRVDARTARAARQVAEVEAIRVRHAERARVDALLHDTVLATLMLASRSPGGVDPALRRQAAAAVDALAAEGDPALDELIDPVSLLRERLAPLNPRVRLTAEGDAEPIPAAIAEPLVDATVEAVRNSLRHAQLPTGHTPAVRISQHAGAIEIVVSDDGVGFSPDAVPSERLGLRSSIYGRLLLIEGATAKVNSAPGRGTVVSLRWEVPQ